MPRAPSRWWSRWWSSLLPLLALVGAPLTSAGAPAPPTAPPTAPAQPQPPRPPDDYDAMRLHMHASFDLVRAIERLLIRGELKNAARLAAEIAMAPDQPAHGAWASRVVAVRERAAEISRATTIDGALLGVARLGAACGDCHAEVTTTLAFATPPPAPPDHPTLEARMRRHRWAIDRLWEGVVGDAAEPWAQGLTVLAAAPLEVPAERAALAKQLRQLAERARRDKQSAATRATTYGEILKVCAGCHTAAERAPTSPPRPAPRKGRP